MAPRIVFMGTPEFAVTALAACQDVGQVVAVVTQPDKPKGRGREQTPPPVKVFSKNRGIPVLQPAKIRDPPFLSQLRTLAPDICMVAAYGKILPQEALDIPPLGCINVHASLLPRFRGASPIQWAIASGDSRTGVCLMKMDAGLDTGPVLACREVAIGPRETFASLERTLADIGGQMIRQYVPQYLQSALEPVPQSSEGLAYAPLLKREEGRLDFSRSATELERRIRAFNPWPGSFTSFERERLKVHSAETGRGRGAPGDVLHAGSTGLEIACGEGSLVLLELQPEGKRRMSAREFLASRRIEVGARPFGG